MKPEVLFPARRARIIGARKEMAFFKELKWENKSAKKQFVRRPMFVRGMTHII